MKRLEIQSMQDSIVAQLTQAILGGDIAGGTELTQVELADELGVSRMPVREALFALEHKGLVTRLPNNHCRVVRPTKRQLTRVLALTAGIEADVLRELVPALCAELPCAERDFHLALREACGEGYPRRVLTTTVDVYVDYLAGLARGRLAEREAVLVAVRDHAAAGRKAAAAKELERYFDLLAQACPFTDEEA